VASAAPANDGSVSRAIATSRASTSASTLSELRRACSASSFTGADDTAAMPAAPGPAVPFSTTSAPSRSASARPAVSAGSSTRGPSGSLGSIRPPSSITGSIGVMYPPPMSPGLTPRASPSAV
jgi:hypothetical protein